MCRRYSRGSKDIGGVGEDRWPDERRQRLGRHQLDSPSEQPLKEFCQGDEAVEPLQLRVELDQQIDISVRPCLPPGRADPKSASRRTPSARISASAARRRAIASPRVKDFAVIGSIYG